MFAKIDVNGAGAHPLYRELKAAAPGIFGTQAVKWNFTKFLITADGNIERYPPRTKPEVLADKIASLLPP
jgi:glutathione peroxidase